MNPGGRRLPGADAGRWRRALDLFTAGLIIFALWDLLVAPRFLDLPTERAPTMLLESPRGALRIGQSSGRVTYLDFWATWCEPCRLSLPLVEAFARAHPDADVLAIDVNESESVAARYASEHGMHNVAFDVLGRAARAYGVVGFPTMVVIDRRGFIRAKWTGFNPAIGLAMAHARSALALTAR